MVAKQAEKTRGFCLARHPESWFRSLSRGGGSSPEKKILHLFPKELIYLFFFIRHRVWRNSRLKGPVKTIVPLNKKQHFKAIGDQPRLDA